MCGRYYIDETMADELERFLPGLGKSLRKQYRGDIFPSKEAPVLLRKGDTLTEKSMRWGFPGLQGKGNLINARAESAAEKRTFQDSVLHRRCVILASGFYEWNSQKEKFQFSQRSGKPLYMAGCYSIFQNEVCFVIFTTQANASVKEVHERMPLILAETEVKRWILDDTCVENMLHKVPGELEKCTEYEQMSLF